MKHYYVGYPPKYADSDNNTTTLTLHNANVGDDMNDVVDGSFSCSLRSALLFCCSLRSALLFFSDFLILEFSVDVSFFIKIIRTKT